jgi:paraquat-inducible protein B
VASLNTAIEPELKTAVSNLNSALIQAQKLTKSLNSSVAPQADRTLKELQAAARSIKVWAAYLERNPEALIRGKSKSKRR